MEAENHKEEDYETHVRICDTGVDCLDVRSKRCGPNFSQDSLAPSPNVLALPPGNNWLLSSWVCVPADCFDIVVAKEYGYASTIAFGTCYGTPSTGAHNPVAAEAIEASGCESPVYLETGTATFQLTTMVFANVTYGLEGLIVPAEASIPALDEVLIGCFISMV